MIYGPNPKYIPPVLEEDESYYYEVKATDWVVVIKGYLSKMQKTNSTKKRKKLMDTLIGAGKGLIIVVMTDLCNVGNATAAKKLGLILKSDEDVYTALPTIAEFFMSGNIENDTFNLKHVLMSENYYTGEMITDISLINPD